MKTIKVKDTFSDDSDSKNNDFSNEKRTFFQQKKNYRNKNVRCKFCDQDVTSKNFVRHLLRHHNHEKEVKDALKYPVKSKERKDALTMIRNNSNFDLFIAGTIRPKRQVSQDNENRFYPCIYCKAIYKKTFLHRHSKTCRFNTNKTQMKDNVVAKSQTQVACSLDSTNVISKLEVKEKVSLVFLYLGVLDKYNKI